MSHEGEGKGMPGPRDQGLTPDLVRELLEEYRHGTAEMAELHAGIKTLDDRLDAVGDGMKELRVAVNDLVGAIRGGNGNPGLASVTAVMDNRVKAVESSVQQLAAQGTPASRAELVAVHAEISTLRTELATANVRQQETLRRVADVEKRHEKTISRGWQVGLFAVSALMDLAALGVAVAALVLKKG